MSTGQTKALAESVSPAVQTGGTASQSGSIKTDVEEPRDLSVGDREPASGRWTFLSNHTHVLLVLYRNPSIVLREVAKLVGITERAVQRIVADLEEEGYLQREKIGRQNHYHVIPEKHLRHPIENQCSIGELMTLICETNRSIIG